MNSPTWPMNTMFTFSLSSSFFGGGTVPAFPTPLPCAASPSPDDFPFDKTGEGFFLTACSTSLLNEYPFDWCCWLPLPGGTATVEGWWSPLVPSAMSSQESTGLSCDSLAFSTDDTGNSTFGGVIFSALSTMGLSFSPLEVKGVVSEVFGPCCVAPSHGCATCGECRRLSGNCWWNGDLCWVVAWAVCSVSSAETGRRRQWCHRSIEYGWWIHAK